MAIAPVQTISIDEAPVHQKQSYLPALVTLGVLYFMMGLITCLNDTLVPFFKDGFTLSYAESSLVQFYFFLTYGLMSIPAGRLVGKIGYKNGIVLGFLIAAFGALLFFPASMMHAYGLFLTALFILAIGIVVLQVAANPYVTVLGPPKTASSRLTLVQGVGSLGTTVAPLLGAHFILSKSGSVTNSSEAVRYPYLMIALVLVMIALVVYRLQLPSIKSGAVTQTHSGEPGKNIFSFRNLNLGAIGIFAYVGAEVSIGTFLTNYTVDSLQIQAESANNYVAVYWGSMAVGRLVGFVILKAIKPARVLSVCAAMSILLIVISVNSSGLVAVWTMIATGLFNSVMFAIIFSLSVNGLGAHTSQASGILSTAIVGGAVVSYIQGWLIDHYSWPVAFMVPLLCYIFILFYGMNGYKSRFANG